MLLSSLDYPIAPVLYSKSGVTMPRSQRASALQAHETQARVQHSCSVAFRNGLQRFAGSLYIALHVYVSSREVADRGVALTHDVTKAAAGDGQRSKSHTWIYMDQLGVGHGAPRATFFFPSSYKLAGSYGLCNAFVVLGLLCWGCSIFFRHASTRVCDGMCLVMATGCLQSSCSALEHGGGKSERFVEYGWCTEIVLKVMLLTMATTHVHPVSSWECTAGSVLVLPCPCWYCYIFLGVLLRSIYHVSTTATRSFVVKDISSQLSLLGIYLYSAAPYNLKW